MGKIKILLILFILFFSAITLAGEYDITTDPDVNSYTQSNIQDLTQSGIGEGLRTFVVWIPVIVIMLIVLFWLGLGLARRKRLEGK